MKEGTKEETTKQHWIADEKDKLSGQNLGEGDGKSLNEMHQNSFTPFSDPLPIAGN